MTTTSDLGRRYERLAGRYLTRAGLKIVATRYRCSFGELDLVCQEGDGLVIVEVKARRTTQLANAAESVDRFKQQRIIAATRHFLMTHPAWANRPLRFDVVAVSDIDLQPNVHWIRDAFQVP